MRDFQLEDLLKSYRARLARGGWTQEYVAQQLEVGKRTYQGWENGENIPPNAMLRRIALLFQLTDAEADALYRGAAQVAPEVQNIPFPRNPYFTGRGSYLALLEEHFQQGELLAITQPVSVSGLGGIGKTQLALEYAHRCYPAIYRTVLWANAATKEAFEASYFSLASLLELPEKDANNVDQVVQAVKQWLEKHTNWLLVIDNVEDLQLARSFLPSIHRGRVLFTTRLQMVGNIATRFEIEAFSPNEGLLFLLRRSGYVSSEGESTTLASDLLSSATRVVELLGGHPLALDQAGAYIEETGVSFPDYLRIYEAQRLTLLKERGSLGREHPETVVVTFEASFRQAYSQYPLAKDVLSCCAFLAPDDIPEGVLSQVTNISGESNEFNKCLAALLRYSLIKRDSTKQWSEPLRPVHAHIR